MCVMEALMVLYAREVVTSDRVAAAVQRFGLSQQSAITSHEDGLLTWINAACAALNNAEVSLKNYRCSWHILFNSNKGCNFPDI